MPSKKLSFNATLFRKNLSRFWPLWGGASLCGAFLPLILLTTLLNRRFIGSITVTDVTRLFYMAAAGVLPVLSLFYAVLAAMAVWSWLYTPRSVGFMHTLPVNRESVFLTSALSGLTMLLIPYAVTGGLTCLILACFRILPLLPAVQTIAAVVGYTLFYFGAATFAAMITSNFFAMPVFYFIGNFFAVIFQTLLEWFAGSLIFGYTASGELSLTFLSPTVAFYRYMEVSAVRNAESGELTITLHGLWIIWAYALVGLVLLVLSCLLYRLRHSESAGEVVAYRALKPIFRYGVALCAALTLGMLLYELLWNNSFYSLYSSVAPLAACMIFAGLVGYYVASMLLAKSHKVFKGSGRGAAIVAALVILLCAGTYFDVLRLGSRVPDAADVSHVQIMIRGELLSVEAGDPRIEEIIALQRLIMDSEEEIRAYGRQYDSWYDDEAEDISIASLHIDYTLQNGRTLARRYNLPLRKTNWNGGADSYESRINRLINDPRRAMEEIAVPKDGSLAYLSVYSAGASMDTDGPLKNTLYAALAEDAAAGRFPSCAPFYEEERRIVYLDIVIELSFRYTYLSSSTGEQEQEYAYRSIQLTSDMTSTLQALLDTGVITADDLAGEVMAGLSLPALPDSSAAGDGAFDTEVVVLH